MKEIIQRFKAPTPLFFKKVQRLGVSLTALGGAIQVIPHISTRISELSVNMMVAGGVIVALAQFAVTNTSDLIDTTKP